MSARRNRSFLIIFLLAVLFLIEIGYASYSTQREISGYSGISDCFDIRFENSCIVKSVGVNLNGTVANIQPGGKSLNVNVTNLQYPGSGIEFSVDIVNKGNTRAKVESIIADGIDDSSDIKVQVLNENEIRDKELEPNERCNIHFTVVWDYNCTKEVVNVKNFNLIINYKQAL